MQQLFVYTWDVIERTTRAYTETPVYCKPLKTQQAQGTPDILSEHSEEGQASTVDELTWVKQDTKKGCGVACVAMVAGITFDDAAKVLGKRGCTKTHDLHIALGKLGFGIPARLRMLRGSIPDGILKVHRRQRSSGWHWIVKRGDKIYDPQQGAFSVSEYPDLSLVSSALPVDEWQS
jgi:hypothetical protein